MVEIDILSECKHNHVVGMYEAYYHENKLWVSSAVTGLLHSSGLSLRAGGRGFSPASKRVAPGYFYWKIEENRTKRNP